ncbi:cysteine hydrolase [Candidatus Woesearchaeota archaeon]|nr:cysteine hydrolase [Candidatus Woesearchaeota archaeon]
MAKNALIVIDVQNYFVNDNTKILPQKIAEFIDGSDFDFVLFAKFVNKEDSNLFKILDWRECTSSPYIDIHPTLSKFVNKNNVFEKSTYSIFKSKKFTKFLQNNNITKLFLCGIDTDACVLASAYDGFDIGYDIKILKDLCLSHYGEKLNNSALNIIETHLQK